MSSLFETEEAYQQHKANQQQLVDKYFEEQEKDVEKRRSREVKYFLKQEITEALKDPRIHSVLDQLKFETEEEFEQYKQNYNAKMSNPKNHIVEDFETFQRKYKLENDIEVASITIAYYNGSVIKKLEQRANLSAKALLPCFQKTQS